MMLLVLETPREEAGEATRQPTRTLVREAGAPLEIPVMLQTLAVAGVLVVMPPEVILVALGAQSQLPPRQHGKNNTLAFSRSGQNGKTSSLIAV